MPQDGARYRRASARHREPETLGNGCRSGTGVDVGFRKNGILYLCENEQVAAKRAKWLEQARPFQIDTRMVGAEEVARLLPGSSRRWPAALYTASDGCAEPQRATPAIANAAQNQGATVLENCAVRGIETEAGRVSGIVTERGPIRCSQIVLAGGAWSGLFCGNLGIRFPQLHVLGCVLRTEPLEGAPVPAASGSDFAFRLRADGGYSVAQRAANVADIVPDSFRYFFDFLPTLIKDREELRLRFGRRFFEQWKTPRKWALDRATPFEAIRTLDPKPSQSILAEGMRNLVRAFPIFQNAKTAQSWAGLMDVTPDAVPVISAVPSTPGFFLASGFSGHGFGIGPGRRSAHCRSGDGPEPDRRSQALPLRALQPLTIRRAVGVSCRRDRSPATLTGFFIASRRNGSPSSWLIIASMSVVLPCFIWSSIALASALVSSSMVKACTPCRPQALAMPA